MQRVIHKHADKVLESRVLISGSADRVSTDTRGGMFHGREVILHYNFLGGMLRSLQNYKQFGTKLFMDIRIL